MDDERQEIVKTRSSYRTEMLQEPISVEDFKNYAKAYLPKSHYDYYASGANGEHTLQEAENAFKRLRLRPRVLRDVSSIDTSTTILGQKIDYPVCVAPTGLQKLAHPDGELATARAAARAGTCMALSSWSNTSLEDIARSSSGLKWFQVSALKQYDVVASVLKKAEKEGFKAIVLTVDCPFIGLRYNDMRNHFVLPPHISVVNYKSFLETLKDEAGDSKLAFSFASAQRDTSVTWDVIHWFRTVTKLPIVVKGIMTVEDAELAVQHGVDAILVSNHGARKLDGVPATIEVLPEIVAAVGDKIEVYVDGGVRFGTDVFKALALGARAVFVGRPVLWGLAYQGEEGVYKVLQILKEELRLAMGLCGCASLKDIVKEMVVSESFYRSKL